MPAFGTLGNNPPALYQGDSVLVFNAESPTTNEMSQEVAIGQFQGAGSPAAIAIELSFSGAPGAFSYVIQESDTDVAADFVAVPVASVINAVNANNFARVDLSPFLGGFVAIFVSAQTANPVTATCKIIRKA